MIMINVIFFYSTCHLCGKQSGILFSVSSAVISALFRCFICSIFYIFLIHISILWRLFLETDIFIGGELPALWPPSSAGEREELEQDVGGCDQG